MTDSRFREFMTFFAIGFLGSQHGVDVEDLMTEEELSRLNTILDAMPDADAAMNAATVAICKTMLRESIDRLLAVDPPVSPDETIE